MGKLVDDNGNEYLVEGILIDEPMVLSDDDGDFEKCVIYKFDLLASGLSREDGAYDSTYSVNSYLKLVYSTTGTYGEYIKITGIKGSWVVSDPQVSVTSASVSCQCSGSAYVNNSAVGSYTPQSYSRSSITNNQTYNTGFRKYVINNSSSQINGTMTTNIRRGTSQWNFNVCVNLVG